MRAAARDAPSRRARNRRWRGAAKTGMMRAARPDGRSAG
ncbi:hypothetical protein BURPS668_2467 [Burkholderia pseudomallei 668]|nr:hypothetical protein BURPS668_2467 [Burkholderia pseudomallei 668]